MGLSNPLHLAFLAVLLLLVFGARRLPEIGRSLGSGIKELKGSLEGDHAVSPENSQQLTAPERPNP